MKLVLVVVLLGLLQSCQAERNARLFFATISSSSSTSTSTTTLTTQTVCWTSSGTDSITACGRRKRSVLDVNEEELHMLPSKVLRDSEIQIPSSEGERVNQRNAKFFLFATSTSTITATATSTTSSYTATLSLTLVCSPSSFGSVCGK